MPLRPTRRLRILGAVIVALVLGLSARLFQIQVLRHDYYLQLACGQWEKKVTLPALRGSLYDRRGTPLAVSALHYKVSCDPQLWRGRPRAEREALIGDLSSLLARSRRSIERVGHSRGRYAVLHEGVALNLEERERLERSGLVHLEHCAQRLYPLGTLGAPLVGQLNVEGRGVSGLEAGLQSTLAGVPGVALVQKDEHGRPLISARNRVLEHPRRGGDVYLTLDHKVQAIADTELERALQESGARAGSVAVLDPHSGDILALASSPAPAAREGERYRPSEWKLLPVQATYEPGSTLKALSSIALLERGGVTLGTQEDAEDGYAVVDGFGIRDDRPHYGFLSFREAFVLSSNICFAKLSARVSDQELFGTLRDLGFGNSHGLALPGEEGGVLREPGDWSRRSRMSLSFGQEISVTPLQITAAFGALATGGTLMRPRILRAQWNAEAGELEEHEPVRLRRVCRPETAATLRGLLGEVVASGTGSKANVPGLVVGGKTGTAQKFEDGKLKRGAYLASFIGLAPLDQPRLVIGVFLDEPDREHFHGGQSAAPAFARIVEKLAVSTQYLHEEDTDAPRWTRKGRSLVAPSFLELDADQAEALALDAGLRTRWRGRGRRVVAQLPDPACRLRPDEPLLLVLGDPEAPSRELPDLRGLSLREARRLALERGYTVIPKGRGRVASQGMPDPRRGGAIPLRLKSDAPERSS